VEVCAVLEGRNGRMRVGGSFQNGKLRLDMGTPLFLLLGGCCEVGLVCFGSKQTPGQIQSALKADGSYIAEPLKQEITDREKREIEIREKRSIGKVLVSPGGKFFLYEWRRSYSWDKDFGSLPPSVAEPWQSWIYRVDADLSATDSKCLFSYESASSYWLGTPSPVATKGRQRRSAKGRRAGSGRLISACICRFHESDQ